jgi:hypothetical protein
MFQMGSKGEVASIGSDVRFSPVSDQRAEVAALLKSATTGSRAAVGPAYEERFVEQRLRLVQIARVEALGEPSVDRSKKVTGLITLALIAPDPRPAAP